MLGKSGLANGKTGQPSACRTLIRCEELRIVPIGAAQGLRRTLAERLLIIGAESA